MRNSTIILKKKICASCGKECFWFSKKRCQQCYVIDSTHAKIAAAEAQQDGLPELIERLDALVSKWVRYSAIGEDGLVECYTSRQRFKPEDLDAGHYISRNCMFLRFDLRNIKPQSRIDNRGKYGLAAEFGKRLEEENPGITEILLEESRIVHRWSRDELKAMIQDFTQRLKTLPK